MDRVQQNVPRKRLRVKNLLKNLFKPVSNDTNATTPIPTITFPTNETSNDTTDDEPLNFTEKRLLYLYCGVTGWMRDLIFGNNDESMGSKVYMLVVLIISCVLTFLYLISTCLSFHMARRVESAQFNSWH